MPSSFSTDNQPSLYGTEYAKNCIYNALDWEWKKSSNYSAFFEAMKSNPGNVNADNFNTSEDHGRDGKIIQCHGYADGLIPADASRMLYDKTWETMALQGVDLDNFYSLFFVPGMQHCSGNVYNAPWYFGGSGQASNLEDNGQHAFPVEGMADAEHDALLALVNWVERGESARNLVTTMFKNNTVGSGILRQRPICKFEVPRVCLLGRRGRHRRGAKLGVYRIAVRDERKKK